MRAEPALELGRESCSGQDHAESCSLLVSDACVDDPRDRCRTTAGDERMFREWRPAGPRCVAAISVFKPDEISRLRRCPHIRVSREAAESGSHTERGCRERQPRDPLCLGAADDVTTGIGQVCGGTIACGGGLALTRDRSAAVRLESGTIGRRMTFVRAETWS